MLRLDRRWHTQQRNSGPILQIRNGLETLYQLVTQLITVRCAGEDGYGHFPVLGNFGSQNFDLRELKLVIMLYRDYAGLESRDTCEAAQM
jgi:hypothetical protein